MGVGESGTGSGGDMGGGGFCGLYCVLWGERALGGGAVLLGWGKYSVARLFFS